MTLTPRKRQLNTSEEKFSEGTVEQILINQFLRFKQYYRENSK